MYPNEILHIIVSFLKHADDEILAAVARATSSSTQRRWSELEPDALYSFDPAFPTVINITRACDFQLWWGDEQIISYPDFHQPFMRWAATDEEFAHLVWKTGITRRQAKRIAKGKHKPTLHAVCRVAKAYVDTGIILVRPSSLSPIKPNLSRDQEWWSAYTVHLIAGHIQRAANRG